MTKVNDDEGDSADGKRPAVLTEPSRATVGLLPPPLEQSGAGVAPLTFLSTPEHHDEPLAEHHVVDPPPSSVNGEVDEEDNWSRHVETEQQDRDHHLSSDDMLLRHHHEGHNEITDDDDDLRSNNNRLPEPEKPELTLKEKLVLRERQRRIETERARLKRQFAQTAEETSEEFFMDEVMGASHSVGEGTLGKESMRAHPDEESADANRLGFNMERFLRNSDSFNPQLEPMTETADGEDAATTGVVMERFLNDPIVVPDQVDMEIVPSRLGDEGFEQSNPERPDSLVDEDGTRQTQLAEPHRSVSFDVDGLASGPLTTDHMDLANASILSIAESTSQPGEHASSAVSLEVQRDVASSHEDALSTTTSADEQPRMLRLTEADMLEMASIEDASIGNAPPSERDDEESLSEIGELADFGGGHQHHHGLGGDAALSHDTPTTAMESASQISGYQSQRSAHLATSAAVSAVSSSSADRRSSEHNTFIEGIPPSASDPSHHLLMSPGAGSVIVHPPSESGRDDYIDDADILMQNSGVDISNINHDHPDLLLQDPIVQSSLLLVENVARVPEVSDGILDAPVNRQRRYNHPGGHDSPPDSGGSPRREDVIDDFDFDKNIPSSPDLGRHNSFHELPADQWSPQGKMNISPLHAGPRRAVPSSVMPVIPSMSYGALDGGDDDSTELRPRGLAALSSDPRQGEQAPLLGVRDDIPPEIITRRTLSDPELGVNGQNVREHHHRSGSVASIVEAIVEDVFNEVRSIDEEEMEKIVNESDAYLASNIWARAFPERQFALLVTLILEVPVLLMITGGSDALCQLIGRTRYQLLIGFLPLTSAISGNVGLQASTLTTRAISHSHVTSTEFMPWFWDEVGAAGCLGVGMGVVLGSVAFVLSGMDVAFGTTVFVAQFISIVTAGITGTFAPLLFSFVFRQDSGKWGGPLETAIQDIVGSFAMVIISYHILVMLGPHDIDPSDICLIDDSNDDDDL